MTLIKCNNPNCVFHSAGFCVQSEITINEKGCMEALPDDEYKTILKDKYSDMLKDEMES